MNATIKEIEVKSILSKSNLPVSDFSVNPYVGCTHACKYCYACFMKRFTNHSESWGNFIDVKNWKEIKNPERYAGKEFFMSSVTDPYNPQEEKFERTKKFLEQFQGIDIKLSIQTKSDLVIRDIELIKRFKNVRVGFSINTLDEDFKNDMDKAVSIKRRISAMKKLHENEIVTTCFISPIFPEITDIVAIIEEVKNYCNYIWLENLNLRGNYKPVILNYINHKYPHLVNLYGEIYKKNNREYWKGLDEKINSYAIEKKLEYVTNNDNMKKTFDSKPTIVNYFYHEKIKRSSQKNDEGVI